MLDDQNSAALVSRQAQVEVKLSHHYSIKTDPTTLDWAQQAQKSKDSL